MVPHIIIPKILKTDIRRQHARMFANVYNSCDKALVSKYLEEFFRNDFTFQQRFAGMMAG
jgi:hypothetical protein